MGFFKKLQNRVRDEHHKNWRKSRKGKGSAKLYNRGKKGLYLSRTKSQRKRLTKGNM